MSKTKRYFIILWMLAGLIFLFERYYMGNHLAVKRLQNYAGLAAQSIEEADEKIENMAASSQFNYLLWAEGHMSDELGLVKSLHPLIRDVLVFSDDYHFLAGTTDRLADSRTIDLLKRTKAGNKRGRMVRPEGIVFAYSLTEAKNTRVRGYLLVGLSLPEYSPEYSQKGSIMALNVTKSGYFANTLGMLNRQDGKKLIHFLQNTTLGSTGLSPLKDLDDLAIQWVYSKSVSLYFLYLYPEKPLYTYIYFYVFLVSLLLTGLNFINPFLKAPDRRLVYEKILEDNLKTLQEMKKGFESLVQSGGPGPILEVEASISSFKERETDSVPVYRESPEERKGELLPSDFILMDPLDITWYKPLKAAEESETGEEETQDVEASKGEQKSDKLRKEAFSDELLQLMEEVTRKPLPPETAEIEHGTQEAGGGSFMDDEIEAEGIPEVKDIGIKSDPYALSLERLYLADTPGEELDIALNYVKQQANAQAVAILGFDKNVGCYAIEFSQGLDTSWPRHFYLLFRDSVLGFPDKGESNVAINDRLMQNSYFRKRIPADYLNRLGGMKFVSTLGSSGGSFGGGENDPNADEGMAFRIVFFYWKDGEFYRENSHDLEAALASMDAAGYQRVLKDIMPVINSLYCKRQENDVNVTEPYKDIYNIFKSFTIMSQEDIQVVHVVSDCLLDGGVLGKLREACIKEFKKNERYLQSSPNHYIFLLSQTPATFVEDFFAEIDPEASIHALKFPEMGKNLFAYL